MSNTECQVYVLASSKNGYDLLVPLRFCHLKSCLFNLSMTIITKVGPGLWDMLIWMTLWSDLHVWLICLASGISGICFTAGRKEGAGLVTGT